MRSNCLLWAWRQYRAHGGYLAMRHTTRRGGWWPHFVWSPDLVTWFEFVPVPTWPERVICPAVWFDGLVRAWTGREVLDNKIVASRINLKLLDPEQIIQTGRIAAAGK